MKTKLVVPLFLLAVLSSPALAFNMTFCKGPLAYADGYLVKREPSKDFVCALPVMPADWQLDCDHIPKSGFPPNPLWVAAPGEGGPFPATARGHCGFLPDDPAPVPRPVHKPAPMPPPASTPPPITNDSQIPNCLANNGQGYGDAWEQNGLTLAKNGSDYKEDNVCVVATRGTRVQPPATGDESTPICHSNNGQGYGDPWSQNGVIMAKDREDFSNDSTCTVQWR